MGFVSWMDSIDGMDRFVSPSFLILVRFSVSEGKIWMLRTSEMFMESTISRMLFFH